MICLPELSAACSGFNEKLVSLEAHGPPCTAGSGARWKEAEGLGPMVSVAQGGLLCRHPSVRGWSAFYSTSHSRLGA